MVMPIDLKHLTQVSLTAGALILSGCAANTPPIAQDRGAGAEQAEVEPAAPAPSKAPREVPDDGGPTSPGSVLPGFDPPSSGGTFEGTL
jgi:hypothetical protein